MNYTEIKFLTIKLRINALINYPMQHAADSLQALHHISQNHNVTSCSEAASETE
jgi:hypothetical protein